MTVGKRLQILGLLILVLLSYWLTGGNPLRGSRRVFQDIRHRLTYHPKVAFYGKVIDQNGAPVKDVLVMFDWQLTGVRLPQRRSVRTSDDGTFQLRPVTGDRITVAVHKPGYEPLDAGPAFFFNDFSSPLPATDKINRFIIALRESNGLEYKLYHTLYFELTNDIPFAVKITSERVIR